MMRDYTGARENRASGQPWPSGEAGGVLGALDGIKAGARPEEGNIARYGGFALLGGAGKGDRKCGCIY